MQAYIKNGVMFVKAENSTESYALEKWVKDSFISATKLRPETLVFDVGNFIDFETKFFRV